MVSQAHSHSVSQQCQEFFNLEEENSPATGFFIKNRRPYGNIKVVYTYLRSFLWHLSDYSREGAQNHQIHWISSRSIEMTEEWDSNGMESRFHLRRNESESTDLFWFPKLFSLISKCMAQNGFSERSFLQYILWWVLSCCNLKIHVCWSTLNAWKVVIHFVLFLNAVAEDLLITKTGTYSSEGLFWEGTDTTGPFLNSLGPSVLDM